MGIFMLYMHAIVFTWYSSICNHLHILLLLSDHLHIILFELLCYVLSGFIFCHLFPLLYHLVYICTKKVRNKPHPCLPPLLI